MPLPDNTWEHLQSTLIKTQNRIVREEFSDVNEDDDIVLPRANLKVASLHLDSDNALVSILRLWLFYIIIGKAKDLQPAIYGIPITDFQEYRRFKPQIFLYFLEDQDDVEQGYARVAGEIKFRLMNQTAETLSEAELRSYANKVKTNFGAANGFVWKKGKLLASYADPKRGYKMQLLCRNESEAKKVVEQVLDIQSHTPDWKYLNVSQNQETSSAYPTIPPTDFILGRSRRLPRKRPIADARFQWAVAHIWGLPNPVVLYDRVFRYKAPLVER